MTPETKSTLVLETSKGPAEVISTDGQNVTLHAGFPAPPGSPIKGVVRENGFTLQVKIHGCRRIAVTDGAPAGSAPGALTCFELCGRWVNLSKEARQLVLGETGRGEGHPSGG